MCFYLYVYSNFKSTCFPTLKDRIRYLYIQICVIKPVLNYIVNKPLAIGKCNYTWKLTSVGICKGFPAGNQSTQDLCPIDLSDSIPNPDPLVYHSDYFPPFLLLTNRQIVILIKTRWKVICNWYRQIALSPRFRFLMAGVCMKNQLHGSENKIRYPLRFYFFSIYIT